MTNQTARPKSANTFNRFVIALQRVGIVLGPMRLVTAPGAKSGIPRTTPIAVQEHAGERYVMQAWPKAAWVANLRAAETVTLTKGRRSEQVRMVELPVDERREVLRALTPGVPKFVRNGMAASGLAAAPTPEAIAEAAPKIAVFRVDPV